MCTCDYGFDFDAYDLHHRSAIMDLGKERIDTNIVHIVLSAYV